MNCLAAIFADFLRPALHTGNRRAQKQQPRRNSAENPAKCDRERRFPALPPAVSKNQHGSRQRGQSGKYLVGLENRHPRQRGGGQQRCQYSRRPAAQPAANQRYSACGHHGKQRQAQPTFLSRQLRLPLREHPARPGGIGIAHLIPEQAIAFQHLLSANKHRQKQYDQRSKEKPLLLLKPDGHAVGDAHVSARRQQDWQQISRPEPGQRCKRKHQRRAGEHRRQRLENPCAVRRILRLTQVHPLFYF